VPKTVHGQRMVENRELFRLRDEDMTKINAIATVKGTVRYLDPRNHIQFDIFNEEADEPVGDGNN
jgi:alcohol dehydrogenase (NADP+)